jgi:hypothetical protein
MTIVLAAALLLGAVARPPTQQDLAREARAAYDRADYATFLARMNNPLFDEPTLGIVANGAYYYVANSQGGRFLKGDVPRPNSVKSLCSKSLTARLPTFAVVHLHQRGEERAR